MGVHSEDRSIPEGFWVMWTDGRLLFIAFHRMNITSEEYTWTCGLNHLSPTVNQTYVYKVVTVITHPRASYLY